MGEVYLAEDTELNRKVALKFLSSHLCQDVGCRMRFKREAQAAAKLSHPNIVTIYEVGDFNGRPFFAMENVEGQNLKEYSEGRELQLNRIIELVIQICDGLAKAHSVGLVHRDIKPSNILIDQDGRATIVDFGLALTHGSERLTKTGSTLGTVGYMSPEQTRGEEVDARTDLFSLGVVLYEMITGRSPFKAESDVATVKNIVEAIPEPLARYKTGVPDDLQRIVNKALSKDRNLRYQHAEDLSTDLKRLISTVGYIATSSKRKRRVIMTSLVIFGILVAVVVLKPWRMVIRPADSTSASNKTIAVLPFANLGGNPEDEYFTDGIMEDIMTQLSKIGELTVISRTTMIQYKGSKKALQEIAKEVNATIVLEGSVRRSGDRLRISSQLINAKTDGHMWADTYDKDMQDVFAIQSDIAKKIAEALKVNLTQGEKERIEKQPTENTDAYSYYLKGREYYYRYTGDNMRTAIELFRKAIALDSNYTLAWAGMSDAYGYLSFGDSAMAMSRRAVELDENSAEGQRALGLAYYRKGFIDSSLIASLKAVELNPNYFTGQSLIGYNYVTLGQLFKAFPWLRKAVLISPTYPHPYAEMGNIYTLIGEYENAEKVIRKALDLQSDNNDVLYAITHCYVSQGKDREANELIQKMVALYPSRPWLHKTAGYIAAIAGDLVSAKESFERWLEIKYSGTTNIDSMGGTMLGYILMKEGDKAHAEMIFAKEVDLSEDDIRRGIQGGMSEYNLATIYALKGDKKKTYSFLQKAIEGGVRQWQLTLRDPRFENVRNDEEFKKLVSEMKAKVDEQKKLIDAMEKAESQ